MKKTELKKHNNKLSFEEFYYKQSLPLKKKIELSESVIQEWYERWEENVYVSFSGGFDSNVLLEIVRGIYEDVTGVFVNTGLEYPEIKNFVKSKNNIIWLRPKKNFKQVIQEYGYPIISKEVSGQIYQIRNSKSEEVINKRLYGIGKYKYGKLPLSWRKLLHSNFKISNYCCSIIKEKPMNEFYTKTKYKPMIAIRADESQQRLLSYLKTGCNIFTSRIPVSKPLSFWTKEDMWEYIKKYKIKYSKIYDMGYDRTGCMFCMFGVHLEGEPNRFQKMKVTHPKYYSFCINNLGIGKILDLINVNY